MRQVGKVRRVVKVCAGKEEGTGGNGGKDGDAREG